MLEEFCYQNNRKLRCGVTTGSCAAAAAKAAAHMLFTGTGMEVVHLLTPKGTVLDLTVAACDRAKDKVSCAIRKDSGDDADVTDGILVYATVSGKERQAQRVCIDGGEGIGRVTKQGLDQPPGAAAINSVPRKMIAEAVEEEMDSAGYPGSVEVVISIPGGSEIAKKTFNPVLGIEGGLSVLGTSGIVEPMSERALVDTIHAQMSVQAAQGKKHYLVTPGNYGMDFIKEKMGFDTADVIKCSNFIGETIDMAYEFQAESMLLVGHAGKLVKLACGVMNTHSHYADARLEAIASAGIRAGVRLPLLRKVLDCVTTDEAFGLLEEEQMLTPVITVLMEEIDRHIRRRACEGLKIGVVMFSNVYGILGRTWQVKEIKQWYIL